MAGYIGNIPTPQATQSRQSFTATASQTTFATIGYTPNYVDVYLNGVHLLDGTDYTATNGSDVVLTVGAAVSDIVEVISYETFAVLDQTFTGTTTADILTVTGAFTSLGIDDNATATAMTLDTSGKVGIGVSPDAWYTQYEALDIGDSGSIFSNKSGATNVTGLSNNTYLNSGATSWLYKNTDEATYYDQSSGNHIWSYTASGTAGTAITWSEAMRIDSSGNLLVGKTSADNTTDGATLWNDGTMSFTANLTNPAAGRVAVFNRRTADGAIVDFRKDGTTVGSIGATSGDLMIGTTDTGFRFLDGAEQIIPWDVTGNTNKDGVLDLGNSTNRFDNLYLSGGVYLGGTGAANLLDDYEEGTFTPVLSDADTAGNLATIANVRANYTKTGNQVNVCLNLNNITTTGMTAGNGFYIQGLPFTAPSYTSPNLNYVGSVRLQDILYSGYAVSEVQDNTSNIMVKEVVAGAGAVRLLVSDITSGTADISISLTYETA